MFEKLVEKHFIDTIRHGFNDSGQLKIINVETLEKSNEVRIAVDMKIEISDCLFVTSHFKIDDHVYENTGSMYDCDFTATIYGEYKVYGRYASDDEKILDLEDIYFKSPNIKVTKCYMDGEASELNKSEEQLIQIAQQHITSEDEQAMCEYKKIDI